MSDTAHILLQSSDAEMRFDWLGFDGDDCFRDFHVSYILNGEKRRFEFGPCVAWGFRKLSRFFLDSTQQTAGLGFRHPDIRYCDVHRAGESYRLVVRYEGTGLHEEVQIDSPLVDVAGEFFNIHEV